MKTSSAALILCGTVAVFSAPILIGGGSPGQEDARESAAERDLNTSGIDELQADGHREATSPSSPEQPAEATQGDSSPEDPGSAAVETSGDRAPELSLEPAVGSLAGAAAGAQARETAPDPAFFDKAAFVSIDFQPPMWRDEPLPRGFAELGITRADVDEARRRLVEVALPNARRVADASRELGMPMIFVHWGYRFPDAMDLDPSVYNAFVENYGPDTSKWPHHIADADSRPADELGVRPGEYVIAKTAQDAFVSSNIGFVLENLGVENLVFVGGDTGACLGNSARSAIAAGYRVLCIEDATFDAAEGRRRQMLPEIGCHHLLSTAEFEALVEERLASGAQGGSESAGPSP